MLDSNGLSDALWCLRAVDDHHREMRLYAVWCARQAQYLMTDARSQDTLNVAERYANGAATYDELNTASAAARIAASATAAWDATKSAKVAELRRVCVCIEQGIDPYPQLQEELK